ncbi:MAG: TonB-dependent hemoglobin/transferrin/lactoferrin family receptor [Phyllobacterium sp.]
MGWAVVLISKRFWLGCVAVGALNVSLNVTAWAQQVDSDATLLRTITVEGRSEGKAGRVLNEPTVLTTRKTREDLNSRQVDTIQDISRLDAGINYNADNDSINIRGLDRNRVLTTIDGIRMPWLSDGARGVSGGVSSFDFNALSGLDLVRGSDSSVFGSGSLGGVVALRTLDPEDLISEGKNWGSLTKGGYDSADRSWNINQALAARFKDTYLLFQGGYREGHERENQGDIGGYGPSRTEKNPLDYDQNNLMFKLHQNVEGGHRFGFTAERFSKDSDEDTRTGNVTRFEQGTYRTQEERKRERVSASYDFDAPDGDSWVDEATAVVYWQRQQLVDGETGYRLTRPIGDYWRNNSIEESTYGASGSALKSVELGGLNHTFTFGGEVFGSLVKQYAAGDDSCPAIIVSPYDACNFLHTNQSESPDVSGTTVGLFVQDEIGFYDNRLRITPGLRFDWYDQRPQQTDSFEENNTFTGYPDSSSGSRLSPKLRAEWSATDNVILYAQWAQAFRAPTATELYFNYGGPGTYLRIGNPDLDPETSNGFDIGAQFGDEKFGGGISLFNNYYRNYIDAVSMTAAEAGVVGNYPMGITKVINRAHVQIYGAEASLRYKFDNGWKTWGSLAFASGKDTDEDEYLNSVPPVRGILGVGYATETWGADLMMTAAASRNKVERNSEVNKTPGYAVFDLAGWWEPEQFKGLKIRAGVYNIFDKKYWNALNIPDGTTIPKDYFTEPGRNFQLSISQRF